MRDIGVCAQGAGRLRREAAFGTCRAVGGFCVRLELRLGREAQAARVLRLRRALLAPESVARVLALVVLQERVRGLEAPYAGDRVDGRVAGVGFVVKVDRGDVSVESFWFAEFLVARRVATAAVYGLLLLVRFLLVDAQSLTGAVGLFTRWKVADKVPDLLVLGV